MSYVRKIWLMWTNRQQQTICYSKLAVASDTQHAIFW